MTAPALPAAAATVRRTGPRRLDLARRCAVMAIVNNTPDSFYDAGRTFGAGRAVAAALAAADAGAGWVDVGGVPFSSLARPVSVAEEIDRVLPVVAAVTAARDVVVSVDTARPEVAAAALAGGAHVVNDTGRDPAMADVVARAGGYLVIVHSLRGVRRGPPRYADVVGAVRADLRARTADAVRAGLPPERILLDPGHDLDKNTHHSLELTRRLAEIVALGLPVVVSLSRKDFVGETLGRPAADRLAGTLAATAWCVAHGARVVRTHDVAATRDAVRMVEAVLGLREPVEMRHNMPAAAPAATTPRPADPT